MALLPVVGHGVLIDRLVPADAPALAESHSDPVNAEFQGWETPLATADARRFIEAQADAEPLAPGTGVQLAIRLTGGGPLVGDLYLHRSTATPPAVDVGITLLPGRHGRGLATAAVAAVLDAVLTQVPPGGPVERVVAEVDVGNVRSRRLFERLGFRLEARRAAGVRRRDGTPADELVFVMTDRRWPEARTPQDPGVDRAR